MNLNINELTLENLGQWPNPVKMGVVAFVAFLVIGMGYWLIAKGNFDEYSNLQAQEKTLRQSFESKQQQAANLQAYRDQIAIMQERFGNMLRQLPTQDEMPGLLEDISKTGIASGLTFELFAPQQQVTHDFYIELPIKIDVLGNYHQFAVFLSRVAQMSRIVTLHDFIVERVPEDKTKAKAAGTEPTNTGNKLRMDITAKVYRYRTK